MARALRSRPVRILYVVLVFLAASVLIFPTRPKLMMRAIVNRTGLVYTDLRSSSLPKAPAVEKDLLPTYGLPNAPGKAVSFVKQREDSRSPTKQLIAVGWFTYEQLTQGCLQFSDVLDAGMKLRRDIVAPHIFSGHIVGIGGPGRITSRYAETRGAKTIPLDTYFDLGDLKQKLATHHIQLLNEELALKTCYNQWTLLLVSNSINSWMPQTDICNSKSLLERYFHTMTTLSRRASIESKKPPFAVEDCSWMAECLDKNLLQYVGAAPNVLCVSNPRRTNIGTLSSVIGAASTNHACLLVVNWFGSTRHWTRSTLERTLPAVEANFPPAQVLRNISRDLLRSSRLTEGRGYTAIHIRFEYLPKQCNGNRTSCGKHKQNWEDFTGGCLNNLINGIQQAANFTDTVVLGMDTLSRSYHHDTKTYSLFRRFRKEVISAMKTFNLKYIPIEQVYHKDRVPDYAEEHLDDDGQRAIVDQLIFSSAKILIAVGGGNYQGRFFSRRYLHQPPNETKDQVYCFAFTPEAFPATIVGSKILSLKLPEA